MRHPAASSHLKPARHFNFHGLPVDLVGGDDVNLTAEIDQILGPFQVDAHAEGAPVTGTVRAYDQAEVLRHLSPNAVRVATPHLAAGEAADVCMELYQEGERFWLVDDRWGMAEINLLKGTWRSWVLPMATLGGARCVDQAVLWPLAQLLRGRGAYLMPAASVVRGDWGFLVVSPFGVEAELDALVRAGYGVVGQRWTCVRESTDGALSLLHVPGRIERAHGPRLLAAAPDANGNDGVDLTAEFCGSHRDSADCDVVLVVEPGRRPVAHAKELTGQLALDALRRSWPTVELHRQKRQLPMKLATRARVCTVQLSRRPEDLLVLLASLTWPASETARVVTTPSPAKANTERRFVPSFTHA